MAHTLIKCQHCEQRVANEAKRCPHCGGKPIAVRFSAGRAALIVLICMMGGAYLGSKTGASNDAGVVLGLAAGMLLSVWNYLYCQRVLEKQCIISGP
jgi:hypothetical protein